MEALLLLLFFPIAWPFVAKRIWNTTISWKEVFLNVTIVVTLTVIVFTLGKYAKTADTEIWNGRVVSKHRDHGSYVESYSCNCRQSCSGSGKSYSCSTTCSTCYRDHYTVTWRAETTAGGVRFDYSDWTSRAVYLLPDPASYSRCVPGEPAAIEHSYTNYVKAVPESLFNTKTETQAFSTEIPPYPRVFDFYRVNRVIEVGVKLQPGVRQALNDGLNKELALLGPQKEVNVIMIVTSVTDPAYRHAVENAWIGGKKNDVVLFVGLKENQIVWADAMTWALNSGNELFQVKMRDGLKSLGTIDPPQVVGLVKETIVKHYDRPHMRNWKYLEDIIQPATWLIILTAVLSMGGSIALSIFFHRN